jgi:transcriptional regulator with XRE-family HTH domain|tara:strand:+ start:738 stop:1226 length:489 start_codon:yes stop_codon:yes gene_type:complete
LSQQFNLPGMAAGSLFAKNPSRFIVLHDCVQYTAHMQAVFQKCRYYVGMTSDPNTSHLRKLREAAGLSLRELARQLDQQPTNISFWERTGKLPRAEVLIPMARALGVSVEEILGEPAPTNNRKPGGKLGEVVEDLSSLPRRQQQRILRAVEDMIAGQRAKAS